MNAEALIQSAKILATITTTTITSTITTTITTTATTTITTTTTSNILILFKPYTIHVSKFIRINYFWFTNNEFLTSILLIRNESPNENNINMLIGCVLTF